MWSKPTNYEEVFPSKFKSELVRPKNLRKREPFEKNSTKLKKKTTPYRYKRYGNQRHNVRKCHIPPLTHWLAKVNFILVSLN